MPVKEFEKPKTLFQQRINEIMSDDSMKQLVESLIKLQLFKKAEKDDKMFVIVELYNLLGLEKFMDVMDILSGRTVKFPAKDDFRETVQIALCYYYRRFRKKSWEEIKSILGDSAMPTVKLGIKASGLDKFMSYMEELIEERNRREHD